MTILELHIAIWRDLPQYPCNLGLLFQLVSYFFELLYINVNFKNQESFNLILSLRMIQTAHHIYFAKKSTEHIVPIYKTTALIRAKTFGFRV